MAVRGTSMVYGGTSGMEVRGMSTMYRLVEMSIGASVERTVLRMNVVRSLSW